MILELCYKIIKLNDDKIYEFFYIAIHIWQLIYFLANN